MNTNGNKFWDFVNEHPIMTFFAFLVLVDAVVTIVTHITH
jgi:hypothetical protein